MEDFLRTGSYQSQPSSTEVNNASCYICIPETSAWRGAYLSPIDNFTFTFN
jgi:hypothetical protein